MLVATFATPFTAELDSEWESYKMTHNKQYEADIEPLRFVVYMQIEPDIFHANNKSPDQPAHAQADQHLCFLLSREYSSQTCYMHFFSILSVVSVA